MGNLTDQVDAIFQQADELRCKLLEKRKQLLDEVMEIDMQILRLPGAERHPAPVSLNDWRARQSRLERATVGRIGQPLNIRDIIHVTATYYGVSVSSIVGSDRHATIARIRHVAMYLVRKHTRESFPEIGRAFGARDHTTIMSAVQKIEQQLPVDVELQSEVEAIEHCVQAHMVQSNEKTAL